MITKLNMTKYWNILKNFDSPNVNNSRDIVKYYIEKFKKTPCMYWASQLEAIGVDVDFNNYDNGN